MERKYYKNGIEAPQQLETANGTIYNYNSEANHEMLIADGYEISDDVVIVIPQIITKLQATLALIAIDKLEMVETAVEASDIVTQRSYKDATVFEYSNEMLTGMCYALGIDKDEFFILASTF